METPREHQEVCGSTPPTGPGFHAPISTGNRERGFKEWGTARSVGHTPLSARSASSATGKPSGSENVSLSPRGGKNSMRRLRGQTVWETPRGVGLTPRTAQKARKRTIVGTSAGDLHSSGGGDEDVPGYSGVGSEKFTGSSEGEENFTRRQRGHTVWETPRGVGLTPSTVGKARREAVDDSAGRSVQRDVGGEGVVRRERGQTVWQTPRGVGLTPRSNSGDQHMQERRGRGDTVWETPRRKDVTPRSNMKSSSRPKERRLRGNTVWETPRGVGLTPRTPSDYSGKTPTDRQNSEGNAVQSGDLASGATGTSDRREGTREAEFTLDTPEVPSPCLSGESSIGQPGLRSFAEGH